MMENKEILRYKDIVLSSSDLDPLKGPRFLSDQLIGFYFTYLSSLFSRNDLLFVPPSVCLLLAKGDPQICKDTVEPLEFQSKRIAVFVVNDIFAANDSGEVAVNDNEDLVEEDSGSHWSTLIYDRTHNAFLHFDTMKGVNEDSAFKLYSSVKDLVGKANTSDKRKNKKKKVKKPEPDIIGEPVFKECIAPQQTNGYDCGIYVLAIAKAICECYSSHKTGIDADWISSHVNNSVEMTFRNEVLQLIQDLKNN